MTPLLLAGVGAAMLAGTPSRAQAQAAPAAKTYHIPAGPLTAALNRFGSEAGLLLSFSTGMTDGLRSPGLDGDHTVPEALAALLAGTGLQAQPLANGGYTLRRLPPAADVTTLPSVLVTASAASLPGALPPAYAGGQVARGARAGLLGDKDFLETPFNSIALTAQAIEDQQARSIGDVVTADPSVRTIWPATSYISLFTIRGFPVQTQDIAVNGVYGIVPPQMAGGPEFVERVEILKGPGALLNGMAPTGAIGGGINLVTKRATDAPITRLTASYGSKAQLGTHVDLGRRFGQDNEWGVRFNGAYRDGRTGVDEQSQRVGLAAVGLDYRGERVRLSVDLGHHEARTEAPSRILYTDNPGFKIPGPPKNTANLGQDWYFARTNDSFALVQGEVDLASNLTAYAALGGRHNDFLGLYDFVFLQNAQGDFRANQYYQPTFSDTHTGQLGLRGKFSTGAVRHEVNLSVDALHTDSGVLAPVVATYTSNLYATGPLARPDLSTYSGTAPKTGESDLSSVALADTVHLFDDSVQLTLGVRQQKVKVRNFNAATGAQTRFYDRDRLTPGVGLVVKTSESTSLYANYIEGLSQGPTAPAGTLNAGTMFAPVRSKQYELGVKHDFGRFAATLSAFQIEQPSGFVDAATNTYVVDGEQRNRGLEINTFGAPRPGVRVLGGVTFMQGKLTRTANGTYDGNHAIGVPSTQLNLSGEWDTPFLPGFTLTGRAIHTSSQYYNVSNSQGIPAWTRLDVGARYATRVDGTPVTVRASIENLLDKDYWAAVSSSFGLARGAPRTLLLSVTADF
jgi:iron complex outermembrane receptor protein